MNKSLIVSENITCDKNPVYTFSFPKQIHDMTLNNNLVKYLLKMKTVDIVNFFNNVQFNQSYRAQNIKDPNLHTKLKTLPTGTTFYILKPHNPENLSMTLFRARVK